MIPERKKAFVEYLKGYDVALKQGLTLKATDVVTI